jgi:hypothetical protein
MSEPDGKKNEADNDISNSIDKGQIKEHPLVGKIVKDLNRPINSTIFLGYIGKSLTQGVLRLYTNLEFNEYLEINTRDILYSEEVSDDVLEYGGNRLWVDDNADITLVKVETIKQQAKFLGGKVTDRFVKPSERTTRRPVRRSRMTPRSFSEGPCGTRFKSCNEDCGTQDTCARSCEGTCARSCEGTCAWDSICICELGTFEETTPCRSCGGTCATCKTCETVCGMNC